MKWKKPAVGRRFTDIHGALHYPFREMPDTKAVVITFITTDCPIANYYQPTLARLAAEFETNGIAFFMVHTDPDVAEDAATRHADDFRITTPIVLDREHDLVARLGATVTPEVFVVSRNANVLYSGRIDDTYADLGRKRPAPLHHDLRDALEAICRGQDVTQTRTQAIGCFIAKPEVPPATDPIERKTD